MQIRFLKWYESADKNEHGDLILGKKYMTNSDIKVFQRYYKLIMFMKSEVKINDDESYNPEYNTDHVFTAKLVFREDKKVLKVLERVIYEDRLIKFYIQLFSSLNYNHDLFSFAVNYFDTYGENNGNWATLEI